MTHLLSRLFGKKKTVKPLSLIDATTGMAMEMQLANARVAVSLAERNCELFMENLRERYGAPQGEWKMEDWAQGFVAMPDKENKGNA